jgi:soluble lytic murein transglycosylase-like protein
MERRKRIFIIGLAFIGVGLFIAKKLYAGDGGTSEKDETAGMNKDELYLYWGKHYGVEPLLIKAVAFVESGENPNAKNPAEPSYGIMQVYYTGSNDLDADGWPPESADQLYNASYNIKIGTQILRWNLKTYGFPKGIAVYNKWSARLEIQPFTNQSYVNKVLDRYRDLGGSNFNTGLL